MTVITTNHQKETATQKHTESSTQQSYI